MTEIRLGFYELRAMVIATQRYGSTVARDGGTFSERNAGNDYQVLAGKVDKLLTDGEPGQGFMIIPGEQIEKIKEEILETEQAAKFAYVNVKVAIERLEQKIREQTEFIDRIRVTLGVMGLPPDAIFGMIKTMREDLDMYEKKAEKDAVPKSSKKSTKKKK